MKLLIGLGNPGSRYVRTRHNAGALLINLIAQKIGCPIEKEKKGISCTYGKGTLFGENVALIKPTTYMNLSGEAILPWIRYEKARENEIIVLHDEIDLPAGEVKLKIGGGHGGHNGIRHIVELTGMSGFYRMKLGIGKPEGSIEERRQRMANWVLERFTSEELNVLEEKMFPEVLLRLKQIIYRRKD